MAFGNISSAKDVCLVLVKKLADIAGSGTPDLIDSRTYGTTNAIYDVMSRAGVVQLDTLMNKGVPSSGGSSENRLRIKYQTKRCNTSLEADMDPCTLVGDGYNTWNYGDLTFGTPVYYDFALNMDEMRQVCEGQNEMYQYMLREAYRSLKTQANNRYIDAVAANFGNYWAADCENAVDSSSDPYTLSIFDTVGNPKPMGFFKVKQQYRKMGFGEPTIIGGDKIDAYTEARTVYAGNVDGFDANRGGLRGLYVDYDLDTVLASGNEHFVSLAPGAAHIVNWHKYRDPQFRLTTDDQVRTILDLGVFFGEPAGRFVVDHTMHLDKCQDDVRWIHKFFLYTEVFTLTPDMLAADCGQCSNGILNWITDCADGSCEDTTGTIAAPAEV
jgi:hypothetical protein